MPKEEISTLIKSMKLLKEMVENITNTVQERFRSVDKTIASLLQRVDALETRLEAIPKTADLDTSIITNLANQLAQLQKRFDVLNGKVLELAKRELEQKQFRETPPATKVISKPETPPAPRTPPTAAPAPPTAPPKPETPPAPSVSSSTSETTTKPYTPIEKEIEREVSPISKVAPPAPIPKPQEITKTAVQPGFPKTETGTTETKVLGEKIDSEKEELLKALKKLEEI